MRHLLFSKEVLNRNRITYSCFNYVFLPSSNPSLILFQILSVKESLMPSLPFLEMFKDVSLSNELRTNFSACANVLPQCYSLPFYRFPGQVVLFLFLFSFVFIPTLLRQSKCFTFGIVPDYFLLFAHSFFPNQSYCFCSFFYSVHLPI